MPIDYKQIEIVVHGHSVDEATEILEDCGAKGVWKQTMDEDYTSVRATVHSRAVEKAMDSLEKLTGNDLATRVLLTDVLVALPRPEEPEDEKADKVDDPKFGPNRVTREELYADASRGGHVTRVFMILAALSAVVASVGIIRDNTGVVIGAMVIAPLLGPSVALSLGATLGDSGLMRRAVIASGAGFGVAIAVSMIVGLLVDLDLSSNELASRTDIGVPEIALAVASGIAAALAFTTGTSSALIGVMVAVALLPPTVAFGMLTVNAEWTLARGAGLLLLVNLAAVNLTAVGTFVLQGVRPARWWEASKAKRSVRVAVAAWSVLLVLLLVAIWLNDRITT